MPCRDTRRTRNESHLMTASTECIEIQATGRPALEEQLEEAVGQLQRLALSTMAHGILVTRHRNNHYTAALSDSVPFGMTHELDLCQRNPLLPPVLATASDRVLDAARTCR